MKKNILLLATCALLAGCATQAPLKIRVTPLGQEPDEAKATYLYALPMSVLRVEVTYREVRFLPGPYGEYAEKYLGITDVIRQKRSKWRIQEVSVTPHTEMDPQHFYSLNVMDGSFDPAMMESLLEKGVLLDGTKVVREELNGPAVNALTDQYLPFIDLGITGNFEERTETMYKTLVTDTSFVQVPVERSVVEQKSPAKKAEEAADFLLEVRTRRFEMLTGEYEVYPDGEAMEAAITKLDQLEAAYLSLFTGKTVTRTMKKSWFIVPESGSGVSSYGLGMFSEQLGFVPADLLEGAPLSVQVEPTGTTGVPAQLWAPGGGNRLNQLFYRVPDIVTLKVKWGEQVLSEQRISLYQSGAMISYPVTD
jgi:hypothetical protein